MRRRAVLGVVFAVLVVALALPATASAVRLAGIVGGFDSPTQVTSNGRDPSGTLYIVEQEGQIWRWRPGSRRLFLDIRDLVSTSHNERGLLSLAFDGGYRSNRLVYVNYTRNDGDVVVARFQVNTAFTRVVERTRRSLLRVEHSSAGNHNGGRVAWGPNGRLYVSIGDGGVDCGTSSPDRAQNLGSRLGKLLSLDPRNIRAGWRIDGYGFRNPWRFSFDRMNGRLYVGDVGQNTWEEVSARAASALGGTPENYQWDAREGNAASGCATDGIQGPGAQVRPIDVYSHSLGCSITGGHVYRGSLLSSALRGWYLFGDFCSGRIWRLKYAGGRLVADRRLVRDTGLNISSFGEGKFGELYVADRNGGIYKLVRS